MLSGLYFISPDCILKVKTEVSLAFQEWYFELGRVSSLEDMPCAALTSSLQ